MHENPLRQYFRRPSIYIKLPSQGMFYDDSVINYTPDQDIPVYPMTAIDEVTMKTPDAVFNGQAMADVIKSCVPAIKDPWKINSIDLDSILIAIKIASNGEELDLNTTCPSCKTESKFGVNLIKLLASQTMVDYNKPLMLGDLAIRFRPLTYFETNKNSLSQYEIQKYLFDLQNFEDNEEKSEMMKTALEKLNIILTEILAKTIESITTPDTTVTNPEFIIEFLQGCDSKTNTMIKDYSIELREKSQIKPLNLKCINCGHEYTQTFVLNTSDFFG